MRVQRADKWNFKLNYLRYDFKNCFCYVLLGNTFFDRQNPWGGLTESDIINDPLYVKMNCLRPVKFDFEIPIFG